MDLTQAVADLSAEQSPENRRAVEAAVMASPDYDPLIQFEPQARELVAAKDHRGLIALLDAKMPGLVLSPLAHRLLWRACFAVGDAERADLERRFMELALATIRSSGTGEEGSPLRVLRVQDEYDILGASGLRSIAQTEVASQGRILDRHDLTDGSQLWFELVWRGADAS